MTRFLGILPLLIFVFGTSIIGMAQTSGKITYSVSVNQYRNLPPQYEYLKARIPEYSTSKMELFFNPTESLYKSDGAYNAEYVRYGVTIPNNQIYVNRATRKVIATQYFLNKNYFIQDSLTLAPWKLSDEKKLIQGYLCQMVYYTDSSDTTHVLDITAWYTSKLRPFIGPENYNTLPGAVLAVDINAGEKTYVASRIEARELTEEETISVPEPERKAIEMNYQEFIKTQNELMETLRNRGAIIFR